MDKKSIKVAVVLGTARIGRQSERVHRFVMGELAKKKDVIIEPVDVRDFDLHISSKPEDQNEAGKRWQLIAKESDAFVIVTPEYNHSFPGELKLLLDSAEEEYVHKPVAVCGVSSGNFGGVRAVEHLMSILRYLAFVPISESVYFSNMKPGQEGVLETPIPLESSGRLSKMFDELLLLSDKLR